MNVAIVGATGNVGRKIIEVYEVPLSLLDFDIKYSFIFLKIQLQIFSFQKLFQKLSYDHNHSLFLLRNF